ncbi:MAG: sulfotransferase family protein, partial [Gemmatimonadota bacterium]
VRGDRSTRDATAAAPDAARADRGRAPVFVVGCPRSGTTLLYHMLLSAGGFANYRAETHVFDLLMPRYGHLRSRRMRRRLAEDWIRSTFFRKSGLDADVARRRILDAHDGGELLCSLMTAVARAQRVSRWADCTPGHLLHLPEIERTIPHARIVHIVRDGRDVALSLDRLGWIRPLPGDHTDPIVVAATFWMWMVRRGCTAGRSSALTYMEIRFEDLVARPRETLRRLGEFIEHDLDYDRIRRRAVGSVRRPNTSFDDADSSGFDPVGRWRRSLTAERLARLERITGDALIEFGYDLATDSSEREAVPSTWALRAAIYRSVYAVKHAAKTHTPLGRLLTSTRMGNRDGGTRDLMS